MKNKVIRILILLTVFPMIVCFRVNATCYWVVVNGYKEKLKISPVKREIPAGGLAVVLINPEKDSLQFKKASAWTWHTIDKKGYEEDVKFGDKVFVTRVFSRDPKTKGPNYKILHKGSVGEDLWEVFTFLKNFQGTGYRYSSPVEAMDDIILIRRFSELWKSNIETLVPKLDSKYIIGQIKDSIKKMINLGAKETYMNTFGVNRGTTSRTLDRDFEELSKKWKPKNAKLKHTNEEERKIIFDYIKKAYEVLSQMFE